MRTFCAFLCSRKPASLFQLMEKKCAGYAVGKWERILDGLKTVFNLFVNVLKTEVQKFLSPFSARFLHIAVAKGRRALAFALAARMSASGCLDLKEHNGQVRLAAASLTR